LRPADTLRHGNLSSFLNQGRIREHGPLKQIFGEPQEPCTRKFLQRVIDSGRL